MKKLRITGLTPDSIATTLPVQVGDFLLSVNGRAIYDVLDLLFLMEEERLTLKIEKLSGEVIALKVHRELHETLGLEFEDGLLDHATSCSNQCLFCFIDQLPPGMRPSLYFKDDDSRLSFLQGNFVTLTNLGDRVFKRIIDYRISPINVSVHTTNPQLRIDMLKNKRAGLINEQLQALTKAGISMNGQIVLVPGVNDGEELAQTVMDLSAYYPNMSSVAIVPVGLTKYRKGLAAIRPLDKDYANRIILQVHRLQKHFLKTLDTRFIFLADEFYIQGERAFPRGSHYEGYVQIENGVGLMQKFMIDVRKALKKVRITHEKPLKLSLATGQLALPYIQQLVHEIHVQFPQINLQVYGIENHYFGTSITVSGLLTGQDIMEQLKSQDLGQALLLPESLLKSDEAILLDDTTVEDIEKTLDCPVLIVPNRGELFIETIFKGRFK